MARAIGAQSIYHFKSCHDHADMKQYFEILIRMASTTTSFCIASDKSGFGGRDYYKTPLHFFDWEIVGWLFPVVFWNDSMIFKLSETPGWDDNKWLLKCTQFLPRPRPTALAWYCTRYPFQRSLRSLAPGCQLSRAPHIPSVLDLGIHIVPNFMNSQSPRQHWSLWSQNTYIPRVPKLHTPQRFHAPQSIPQTSWLI